jgi:hypothetical protein
MTELFILGYVLGSFALALVMMHTSTDTAPGLAGYLLVAAFWPILLLMFVIEAVTRGQK